MSSAFEQKRLLSSTFENDIVSLSAAESITFNFGAGTDTTTNRYLSLPDGFSYGIELIPTVACSIIKINSKTLKAGISIGTGGFRMQTGMFKNITIQAGSATTVEILGKC